MKKINKALDFLGVTDVKKTMTCRWMLVLVVLAVCIALSSLIGFLPYRIANIDVKGSDAFRVSAKSRDWLKKLDTDVTLYLVCDGGIEHADADVYGFLLRYTDASPRVKLEVLEPEDSRLEALGFSAPPASMSVIVQSDRRWRLIEPTSLYYYYNTELGVSLTPEQYAACLSAYTSGADQSSTAYYYGYVLYNFASSTSAYFDGESRVTNAINYVTRETVPTLYRLTGNGSFALDAALESILTQTCYDIVTFSSLEKIPDACELMLINTPSFDLSDAEAAALSAYLENGGKLFLTTNYAVQDQTDSSLLLIPEKLESVLSTYGLGFEDSLNIVLESDTSYLLGEDSPFAFLAHTSSKHPITEGLESNFLTYYSHAITLTETEGVTLTNLLYTSDGGKLLSLDLETKEWTESEEARVLSVGAVSETGETKIVWLSSPQSLAFDINTVSQNTNFALALSALNYLSDTSVDAIAIESAAISVSSLSVTVAEFVGWSIVLVVLLPLSVVITGVVVRSARKKRL